MHVRFTRLNAAAPALFLLAAASSAHAQSPDPANPTPLPHISLHPAAPQPAEAPAPQESTPPPSTPAATEPPLPPAPEAASAPAPTPPPQPEAPPQTQAPGSASIAPHGEATKSTASLFHKEKVPYTGPTEIITLPPTPMLDEEGKQRLDPDGKPMFNAPVKQQRDKFGHPLFDEAHKPVFQTATDLGYDEHGKKLHSEKVKPPKMTPMSIARGTFTVDGVIAKAELNYDIADMKFLYFYVPGMGVTVVSNQPFPGSRPQKDAFNDLTLTVSSDGHTLELAGEKRLLDKKPEPAYVLVDRDFHLPSRYPVVGYGTVAKAPYQWPGSRANAQLAGVAAPPIPKNLEPTLLLKPCPQGQMRMPAPKVLPGQPTPDQPCVPIAQAQAAAAKARQQTAQPSILPVAH